MKLSRLIIAVALACALSNIASAAITHRYSFDDGTGNDSVGTANGTLQGAASIAGGQLIMPGPVPGANTNWLDLPGSTIAINTYSALSLEMWSTQPTNNQGFSMTASFGGTWGNGMGQDYLNIATTRGNNVSRGAIALTPDDVNPWEDETGADGPELNDNLEHYYALTISGTQLKYYIDGVQQGTTQTLVNDFLSGVSTDYAYLGKGIYSVDGGTVLSINEFRMWDGIMSDADVLMHFGMGPSVVPEPSSLALFGLGALAALRFLRRRSA